ncbi:MAG TPA: HAMP domain-containing sensor histidine kinase [Candidatus Saccharimonadales bacterium]|nr:HAMP domain-containing sensor histidine kinase [Candidatus Saccharimonadales bacterium]
MIVFATHIPPAYRILSEINIEHLRELQRFAEVGRVSAGLIHDISSPLTAAILHLEQSDPRRLPNVRHARQSIKVLERYVEAARRQLSKQEHIILFRVNDEIDQIKHILQPLARERGIRLVFNARIGNCRLLGDPVKFQRIIVNLVMNGMDACEDDSSSNARPPVKVVLRVEGKSLALSVHDRGRGVSPEQLPHLFKPFYTTKQPSRHAGSGIGLSTVRHYAEDVFGGTITVNSREKAGAEFRVTLPLHSYDDC